MKTRSYMMKMMIVTMICLCTFICSFAMGEECGIGTAASCTMLSEVTEYDYTTEYRNDPDRYPGSGNIVIQEGKNGIMSSSFLVMYEDGIMTGYRSLGEEYTAPVNEIISVPAKGHTVETREEETTEILYFQTRTVEDPDRMKGEPDKIIQEGKNGSKVHIYTVTYTDGVETARTQKSETVTEQPVEEIVSVATGEFSIVYETVTVETLYTTVYVDAPNLLVGDPMAFKAGVYNLEKIKKGLVYLGVSFVKIDYFWANQELFDYVYRNNLYEINADNIRLMLEKKCGHKHAEEVLYVFMSFVLQSKDIPFCNYMSGQLQKAMTVYLNMYSGAICDVDSVVVEVLNHEGIEDEQKERYIKRLIPKVSHLDELESPDLQALLLINNKAEYTVENMLDYYVENGFDGNLISFINTGNGTLVFSEENDKTDEFVMRCLQCDELDDGKYLELVQAYNVEYDAFDIQDISDNHMSILIKTKTILMNQVNLVFMRSNYPDKVIEFILENKREYLELVKGGEYNISEIKQLLERKELNYNYKLDLVKHSSTSISISGMTLEDSVKNYILTNRLHIADLPWFMENYKQESKKIRDRIFTIMTDYIDETVQDADSMCYVLRIRVFASDEIDRTDKIRILGTAAGKMSNDEVIKSLRNTQLDAIADNLQGKNNRVDATMENTQILNALAKLHVIQAPEIAADRRHFKKIRFIRK